MFNLSLGFGLAIFLGSKLPHQQAPLLTWVNHSLYFLMFLQCVYVLKKETLNKDIFFNIALFCFFYSIGFITLFIGEGYVLGNYSLTIYIFQYKIILFSFLLGLSVIYICVKYAFRKLTKTTLYAITLLTVLPVLLWSFYPIVLDMNFLLHAPDYSALDNGLLKFTFFVFIAICFYGFCLYNNERSMGEHINSLMVCFFIMTLLDLTDTLGYIYQIKLFSLSQYILLLILSFFIITLFRKINFIYSEFGQFYDNLIVSGNNYGVPIKRKRTVYANTFLTLAKSYFYHRKNVFGLLALGMVLCLNYLQVSNFLKLNLIAVFIGFLMLSAYVAALYQKRMNNGNLLLKRHNEIVK